MAFFYRTEILKIERQRLFSDINAASAEVWNACCALMDLYQWQRGYGHAHADFYIGEACEGWIDKYLSKSYPLHSQSRQHIRERYFKSWRSYATLKKNGGIKSPKPPNKRKQYMTTQWKKSAITFVEDNGHKCLKLSMGMGRPKLEIPLPKNFNMSKAEHIATIELKYNYGRWELHFSYRYEIEATEVGDGIVGVDIGEIHPIVSHDGTETRIFNGRYIRSLYRLRNKVLAEFSQAISRCSRRSKRWWRLTRRKWSRLKKIDNQIKDALHKQTTKFVKYCESKGIGTIILGDLRGIRTHINYGRRANQKLHQWAFSKITDLITYKAQALGIKVETLDESYTSQTCPKCGNRKKLRTRNYTCACGFKLQISP